MNLMDTAQLLGNFGEFVGAIAVVGTLFYLAVQVKHSKAATEANTRSIEESRRLAVAQTYHARAAVTYQAHVMNANGPFGEIMVKVVDKGLSVLSDEERARFNHHAFGQMMWFDNLHYQYQQGFIESEYYESMFIRGVRIWAPIWKELGLDVGALPKTFARDVERILASS